MRRLTTSLFLKHAVQSSKPNRLVSFLLFEKNYTKELIDLGYSDGMRVRDELLTFLIGEPVPRLIAPDWVTDDLSRISNI